ncbi:MAG: two-component system response regulator YesN [Clostridium sp.]|jgi:two-component system response regulator YesN
MLKVLIVDDEFYSREGLKNVISWGDFGCEVCGEAEDAEVAIELARRFKPDLIITDINMPTMNGIDMAKVILKELVSTKFIIITGYDDFQYARGAIKINAVDFILKPIEIEEFLEALKKAVNIINNDKISKRLYYENQLHEDSFYKGGGKLNKEKKNTALILDYAIVNENIKEITKSIIYNNRKAVEKSLDELYKYIRKGKFDKNIILKINFELIFKIKNELTSLSIPITELEKLELKGDYNNIQEIETVMYGFLMASIDLVREYYGKLEDNSLGKAIKYINENFNNNISLKIVANQVYLNESYLSRSLKYRLGMGFSEYIRGLRMEKAIELLKKGHSISRVAQEVGYSDYRQFSINFKKHTGYNPSSYR